MTKAEEDVTANVQQKSSTPEVEKKKDKDRPPSKIVIRRLPPSLTPENFLDQVSPLPDHDFFYFVRADLSLGQNAFCRAYVNFLNAEDIFIFRDKFDGYVFLDEKGGEYPAVVEFAPFHKVTKKRQRKVDSKCGTLEQDSDYKRFLEMLENPPEAPSVSLDAIVEEVEAKELRLAKMGTTKTNTPLLEYLKRRKEEKRMNMVKLRDERRRGGRDRDYDRRRSAKEDGSSRKDRDRDRQLDRDRRKERAREMAREKERERRRDRDRGGGGGKQRERRNEGGSGRYREADEKPKPIMLLKNTERESQAVDEPSQDRMKGDREDGRYGKEERGGGGGDKWKKGDRERDRRRDWDERPPKSGRDRGGGGGDGRRRNEEFRDKGGKWKEDGRSRGGMGAKGGGGIYRDEDDHRPPRRGDKKWDEKGGGDRSENRKENDRERGGGGGGGGRDRMREDNKRGGGGRNRDEWRENRDRDREGGSKHADGVSSGGKSGGGTGRDREGDTDRKRSERERDRKSTMDSGGGGGGGKNSNNSNSNVRKAARDSTSSVSKDSREDMEKDKRKEEGNEVSSPGATRVKGQNSTPDSTSSSSSSVRPNNKTDEGGGEEKGGNLSETGSDVRRKRKERPERQIYIPRRALEKQRQNSPQSGEGDGAKGGKTG